MKKIPTIFQRDMSRQPALVTPEWHPDCLWVRDGEGVATRKYDGTACLVRATRVSADGVPYDFKLYKRRELRPGDATPAGFESLGWDENTGKAVGWVPVSDGGPEDQWHREAFGDWWQAAEGTYELLGPKVQGNKEGIDGLSWAGHHCDLDGNLIRHVLQPHADADRYAAPRDFEGLRAWLADHMMEGLVWHHPDGRMAKIKRRDFGLKW